MRRNNVRRRQVRSKSSLVFLAPSSAATPTDRSSVALVLFETESQPRNSPALSRAIMAWREDIVAQLRQRDLREKEPFAEMMAAHHALAERSDALQAENRQLQFTCERLKIDGGDGSGGREAIL